MIHQHQRDTELHVTATQPGQTCDNPLAVTTLAEQQSQERPHWFTCTFPGEDERIAIIRVYGAQSQEHARAAVQTCWKKSEYVVGDGDETHGHAAPFTLNLKRNVTLLRFEAQGQQEVIQE